MNRAEKNIVRAEAVAKAYAALTENSPYEWEIDYHTDRLNEAKNELEDFDANLEFCPEERRADREDIVRKINEQNETLKELEAKKAIYVEIAELIVDKIR